MRSWIFSIILIWFFAAQETFLITVNFENRFYCLIVCCILICRWAIPLRLKEILHYSTAGPALMSKKVCWIIFCPIFTEQWQQCHFLKILIPLMGSANREQTWAEGTSEIFKRRNSRFYCTYVFWFPPTRSLDGFLATWNMTHHPLFWTCGLLS